MNDAFEQPVEQTATQIGSHPTDQHDPPPPLNKKHGCDHSEHGGSDGRPERGDDDGHVVSGRPGLRAEPGGELKVDGRQRVMVNDVFRDPAEDPERRDTQEKPDREMEPQIFAGGEA